jgi:hypothetical protein
MNKTEACKILNIPLSVSYDLQAIKASYRVLSKKHHPDKGGDCDKMAIINAAYTVLLETITTQPEYANSSLSLLNDIFNLMLANYLLLYTRYTYPNIK